MTKATPVEWRTTQPHPYKRAHRHGADQGQLGWRLHAVPKQENQLKSGKALCGVRPTHGWGLDLFITDTCDRCEAQIVKHGLQRPETP